MVHLGDHPEVAVCTPCAHSLSRWASDTDDRSRSGLAVRTRGRLRRLRTAVIRHGWHRNRIVGRALRRIGRFTP